MGLLSRFRKDKNQKDQTASVNLDRDTTIQPGVLIQSIADALIVIETTGTITLMNPAAAAMTGWPADEARGLDARAVVILNNLPDQNSPAAKQDPFSQVLVQKQPYSQTAELTGRDGRKLVVSVLISPIIQPNTNQLLGAVAVLRDVSEAHREEKRRAEFISTASHEMRTPVAAIEGYLALALNDRVSKIDAKAREYLEKAHSSTQSLGKLFQDLLTSAKAEDGRLSNHPVVVELSDFLAKLVEDFRFSAEKKGLTNEFVIGSSNVINADSNSRQNIHPLYYVWIDPDRLQEVMVNLFDNAVKYTETGKVTIGLTGDDKTVQVYVKDTGMGIPEEDIKHLFEKFYRVDNSATRTVGGTGLGLFICAKIIELSGGRIWVESQLGKGSTFYINLPRVANDKATELLAKQKNDLTAI